MPYQAEGRLFEAPSHTNSRFCGATGSQSWGVGRLARELGLGERGDEGRFQALDRLFGEVAFWVDFLGF